MHGHSPLALTQHFIRTHMEQRNLEASLDCLSDSIEWFGTGSFEVVHGKEAARHFLAEEIAALPAGYTVVFEEMTQTLLSADCATVFGRILVTDRAVGSQMDCRVSATCVQCAGDFLIASLHMSLPSTLQNGREYYPLTIAAQKVEEIRTQFFNVTLPGGLVACEVSDGFRVRYVNDFLARLLGYESKTEYLAAIGGLFVHCFGEGENIADMAREVQSMEIGGHRTFTYRLKKKSGEELWFRGYTYKYEDKGVAALLCFCMDISDIIQLENELKEQKNRLEFAAAELQTIVGNIPGGVHRCPLFDRISVNYVSQGFEELSGYTGEEIHTLFHDKYNLLLLEDDRSSFAAAILALSVEPAKRILEYRMRRKDGTIIRVVDHFRSVRMEDGKMWGFGVATDVTAQHEALAQLQLLTDSIPGGLVVYDSAPSGINLVYFSDGVCAMVGYTREEYAEIAEANIAGFALEEDLPLLHAAIAAVAAGDNTVDCVYRHRTKSGGYRWLNVRGTVGDRWGTVVRVNAVLLDITEAKEAAEQLRIRDEEYSLAIAQSGKIVYRYTIADKSLYLLQKAEDPFGFPTAACNIPENLIAQDLFTPESANDLIAFYRAIANGEKTGCVILHRRLKNGDFGWCLAHFTTLFSSSGAPISAVISIEDVTRQQEQELENETLRQKEELFQVVVSHSDRFIIKYDIKTRTAYLQPRTAEAFSIGTVLHNVPDCWRGKTWLAKESEQLSTDFYEKLARGVPSAKAILKIRKEAGHWGWYRFDGSVIFDDQNRPSYAVISFVEITKQYEKELAFERMNQHINRLSEDAMLYFEANLTEVKITRAGGCGLACLTCSLEENPLTLMDATIEQLVVPEEREAIRDFFNRDRLLADFAGGRTEKETELRILHGTQFKWVRTTVELVADPYTEDVLIYVLFRDIDQSKIKEINMLKQAQTDGLTDLYNRSAISEKIKQLLSAERNKPCAFLIIDVDNLKRINDSLGHMQGDHALRSFADILRSHFGARALVGRIGGDEFLVFLPDVGAPQALTAALDALIGKLSALRVGENGTHLLHGSVGVAVSHSCTDTFETLYEQADTALYYVKRHGKNGYALYPAGAEEGTSPAESGGNL